MPIDETLKNKAIEMMKNGRPPEAVHTDLVYAGADPHEVHALLTELVELKRKADAMNPARLREEGKWMLLRGAGVEDVVAHFKSVGIPEEHARAEALRIRDATAKLRPCQRCGTPSEPPTMVMDLNGTMICNGCNLRDEIGRSEQRGLATELQAFGVSPLFAEALANTSFTAPPPNQPFCQHCHRQSGAHVSQYPAHQRAQFDPRVSWICTSCGRGIA